MKLSLGLQILVQYIHLWIQNMALFKSFYYSFHEMQARSKGIHVKYGYA